MKQTAIASLIAVAAQDLPSHIDLYKVAALLVPLIVGVIQALRRPPRREPKPRRQPIVSRSVLPLVFGLVALALFAGCKLIDVPRTVEALGRNTNAVTVHVQSAFGSVDVRRNAPEGR